MAIQPLTNSSEGPGVAWYVGQPACGKTTKALDDAATAAHQLGWPICLLAGVDTGQADDQLRPARNIHQALHSIAAGVDFSFCPAQLREADDVLRAIKAVGQYVIVVDEAHVFISARKTATPTLLELLRTWRHQHVRIMLTTQHFSGDLPGEAISCSPAFYVFRTTNERSLKALQKLGGDPEQIKALPQYRHCEIVLGFA